MEPVPLPEIKEKLQQVIDELADYYGDTIKGLVVDLKIEKFPEGPLSLIDKVYIKVIREEEITF